MEGIPVGIKDNILIEGMKATAGSKMLSHYVAPYNAGVINKLEKAGAIFVGKTNMDEFAMGSSGETSYFGPTKNPCNLKKVPGGSSSGSASAVASHEVFYALGSDTGGSVRLPASFTGTVGLKPTYGRVSRHGLMSMASSFDQIGILAKTVRDAAYVFEHIAGRDEFDATSVDKNSVVVDKLGKGLNGLKIGIPQEYFVKGMDVDVEKTVKKAISKLTDLGAEVKPVNLPLTEYALSVYYILQTAEVSSNLARYDGVRYGFRAEAGNLAEMYLKTRKQGFAEEVKRRIFLGTYVLSSGYQDEYYKQAQKARRLIKQDFETVFKDVDCLVTPTAPSTAFDLGEKFDDPLTMYLADIFTVSANVAGLPAISIPCGLVDDLPVGLQLMGSYYDEATMLDVAANLEQENKFLDMDFYWEFTQGDFILILVAVVAVVLFILFKKLLAKFSAVEGIDKQFLQRGME